MFFCSFLEINPHNFVKDYSIFKNKGLFYENIFRALQEIRFMWQESNLCLCLICVFLFLFFSGYCFEFFRLGVLNLYLVLGFVICNPHQFRRVVD